MEEEIKKIIEKNKKDIGFFEELQEESFGNSTEELRYYCIVECRKLAVRDLKLLIKKNIVKVKDGRCTRCNSECREIYCPGCGGKIDRRD